MYLCRNFVIKIAKMRPNNDKRQQMSFTDKKRFESGSHRDGNRNFNNRNSNEFSPRNRFAGSDERPRNNFQKPYNHDNDRPHFGNNRQKFDNEKPRFDGDRRPNFNNRERFGNNEKPRYNPNYKNDNKRSDKPQNSVYSKKKQFEYKKQFIDWSQPMRLNRFLANSGICSRREADEFIAAGVVSVNGTIVTELGTKIVPSSDRVLFHDQLVRAEKRVYILLNKPKNCVTTSDDPQERQTVMDLVKGACSERVYPVGRLDRNTTGVLLITNDGDLASKMTHPKYNRKKIYEVGLNKDLTQEDVEKIREGIMLDDGEIHADALEFIKEGVFNQVGIEIHSGRNRIVRRIFEHLGYTVIRLDRVYFAGLTKKNLPRGRWRFLSEAEVNILKMS